MSYFLTVSLFDQLAIVIPVTFFKVLKFHLI